MTNTQNLFTSRAVLSPISTMEAGELHIAKQLALTMDLTEADFEESTVAEEVANLLTTHKVDPLELIDAGLSVQADPISGFQTFYCTVLHDRHWSHRKTTPGMVKRMIEMSKHFGGVEIHLSCEMINGTMARYPAWADRRQDEDGTYFSR